MADAQAKVNDLTKQLADATDDVKPGIQKQLDAAKGELKTAQTGQAQIEAQNQAFENAKTATQQAKAELTSKTAAFDDANNVFKNAKADYNLTSSNQ